MLSNTVAITGATGYVGGVIAGHLGANSYKVVTLTRSTDETMNGLENRYFDLNEEPESDLLRGIDVLIHAAWNLGSNSDAQSWDQNVVSARKLFECAQKNGVTKVIFISSMSAYEGTRQSYGLMKLSVEQTALDLGYAVVRPGLVYGPGAKGMAGTLTKISKLPLWPSFRRSHLFLVHQDDLATALQQIIVGYDDFCAEVTGLANENAVSLSALLSQLSSTGASRPTLRIPSSVVMKSLRAFERLGVKFPFRSDSLLGIVEPPKRVPGFERCQRNGIRFRPLS